MPPTSTATKSGTRRLSDVAKHLVAPRDIVATGWPDVRATCRDKMGVTFDDWQDGAGRLMLAKRADGHLAAMIDGVGLSLCRQVGKTYLVGATVFALCINNPGLLVIWSAHHARTHGETFLAMQGFAKRPKVSAHVSQVYTGSGDEEIRFHNGSRILFGARERGFGRGIPGVDVLIFDEAQILSDKALANMLATMNTSSFGLQLYIGTPPKPDDMSESFTRMRTQALAGTLTDGAWIEFGAQDDADGDDRAQWRKANPSFPKRTPAQSMLRLKRKLAGADWRREGLGIWDSASVGRSLFPPGRWTELEDHESSIPDGAARVFAVDLSWSREWAHIAEAGVREDGLVDVGRRAKVEPGEVKGYLESRVRRYAPLAIVVQGASAPVASLVPELESLGLPLHTINGSDVAKATGNFYDALTAGRIRHRGEGASTDMNESLSTAVPRSLGDGWAIDRKKSPTDVAGLVAVVEALWVLDQLVGSSSYDVASSVY